MASLKIDGWIFEISDDIDQYPISDDEKLVAQYNLLGQQMKALNMQKRKIGEFRMTELLNKLKKIQKNSIPEEDWLVL